MTSNTIRALDQAVDNRGAYFTSSSAKALDYVTHVIGPALTVAVNETKTRLPPRHDVDIARIVNVVHYTSLQALFAMICDGPEPGRSVEEHPGGSAENRFPVLTLI